jgi:hypothetical protein
MKCSHATANRHKKRIGIVGVGKRDYFVQNVLLVFHVAVNPSLRMCPKAIETFLIDAVERIHLKPTLLYVMLKRFYNVPVLVIEKPGRSGRE